MADVREKMNTCEERFYACPQGPASHLASLGMIPNTYDIAVSTACSALNNMDIDTVAQDQACIELLRKRNTGMTPGGVSRLFDLIKRKDPRFAVTFYKDSEQAARTLEAAQQQLRDIEGEIERLT
ncbi:hypothetical protein K503DRAFT_787972 [Rhizopogon vinicolor AM-OR11-026]|uniref:Uncharacterized protein n=1 Tax=Rhizopogon vinicolor AM-OR11-026 TaxID=1314800 RepID=A0A1B7MF65_9AGAM|nr:hypothetical protein K503DRAFT_787972 [Rhizopogon vinicolor AM-OR11-026]